jgi:hypothetical protein
VLGVVIAAVLQATVAFATVAQGTDSRITEPREVAVRSTGEWQALWKEHSSQAPPVVDFSSSIVVGVFLGSRPTAGPRVEIVTIQVKGELLVVEYRERAPAPGALVAQILTSPFHFVRLPRSGAVIQFRKVELPA